MPIAAAGVWSAVKAEQAWLECPGIHSGASESEETPHGMMMKQSYSWMIDA